MSETKKTGAADREKLAIWQERLAAGDKVWSQQVTKMDQRDALYNGSDAIEALVAGDTQTTTSHVQNIIFENIESQISTAIPMPKVTACRQEDEDLARIIENMIRNELDRQPFEMMNDLAERTVPIQGGVFFLTEWNNAARSFLSIGELANSVIHPKQFVPQPGIYTDVEDMDWFIIKFPTTKAAVKREYGVDVTMEGESEPEVRGTGAQDNSEDTVTKYVGYERSEDGYINKYVWVNDTELENLENYQARRQPVCAHCGRVKPHMGQPIPEEPDAGTASPEETNAGLKLARQLSDELMMPQGVDGSDPEMVGSLRLTSGAEPEVVTYDGGPCPWCGSNEWTTEEMQWEEVITPVTTSRGVNIPGVQMQEDPETQTVSEVPTKIPFYRPDIYPVVLQRSVSQYGQLLGNSDVDIIADQQNTLNRIHQKIIDRILKAGTRISLPDDTKLRVDPKDGDIWYLEDPAAKQMIDVYEFSGNLQYEMAYKAQIYEEPRQMLGITDSFQGRRDPTATSGKAKEYAASMSAGRLESKRMMKNAAYAKLFEIMFKFMLAYSDEPRLVAYKDHRGDTVYEEFNRYDFLVQDALGQWQWNDRFLFSVDTTAPLAANREAMWQETRMNLQTGAFGDPAATETLILFWSKMEQLHYPGAGSTRKYLEERLQAQQAAPVAGGMPMQMPQTGTQPAGAEQQMTPQAEEPAAPVFV